MSDPAPISILGARSPSGAEIAEKTFPNARRGLDAAAVRRYLAELAVRWNDMMTVEAELRARLAEAERRAAEPSIDAAKLSAAVGSETARVLQAAHEAAAETVTAAEARAAVLVEQAEAILAERRRESEEEAELLLLRTRQQCQEMVDEAREVRARMLADLAERRRALRIQLEQLRAGTGTLAGVIDAVGDSVHEAIEALKARLHGAEEEARLAADAAAHEAAEAHDEFEEELRSDTPGLSFVDPLVGTVEGAGAPPSLDAPVASAPLEAGPLEAGPLEAGPLEAGPLEMAPSGAAQSEPVTAEETVVDASEDSPGAEGGGGPVTAEAERPEPAGAVPFARAPGGGEGGVADGPPAVEVGADLEDTGVRILAHDSVDELFARIRADRASDLVESPPATEAGSEVLGGVPGTPEGDEAAGFARGDDEEQALRQQAAQLLGPGSLELSRALKRALRVEQNDLLDAARQLAGRASPNELFAGDTVAERLASAASRPLTAAWRAGAAFFVGLLGEEVPGESDQASAAREIEEIARLLAGEIAESVRDRFEEAAALTGEEEGALAAAVATAFRDWRGQRVENLAGDYASRAFAGASLEAAKQLKTPLRWVSDDGVENCPDCDDNALAADQVAGEPFPTGHVQPPAHPGCRCLLVPSVK